MGVDTVRDIIAALECGKGAGREEITAVLNCQPQEEGLLFEAADRVRRAHSGKTVYIRSIIEFSNVCRCSCYYCGLRKENQKITRYRMQPDEILETALRAAEAGYRTVILQSGEDLSYSRETIGDLVKTIKQRTGVTVTLSCGERPAEDYQYWKKCGADRYLIKHETSDPELYRSYHPHSSFERRIKCLRELKALGYEIGSGFMVGLPESKTETLAGDLLLLKELGVEMAGIGPFISHPETPLGGANDGRAELTLRCVALARLLLPDAYLPSTTALNVKGGLHDALSCGANVIMQKATPGKYRDLYDIYPGRESSEVDLKFQLETLKNELAALGWRPE